MKISTLNLVSMAMNFGIGATALALQDSYPLDYSVVFDTITLFLDVNSSINVTPSLNHSGDAAGPLNLNLYLMQTSSPTEPNKTNVLILLEVITGICLRQYEDQNCPQYTKANMTVDKRKTFPLGLKRADEGVLGNVNGLFFCFTNAPKDPICDYYSNIFSLNDPGQESDFNSSPVSSQTYSAITTPIMVTTTVTTVLALMQSQTTKTLPSMPTSAVTFTEPALTFLTVPSSATAVSSNTASPTTIAIPATSQSKGLSNGAKVGIALGPLIVFALILLSLLWFLRRKHASRSSTYQPPEQVMLTRSMHTDSFGASNPSSGSGITRRNAILAEKEDALISNTALSLNPNNSNTGSPISPQINTDPIHNTSIQHSPSQSPYAPLLSLPYNGASATIPRRKSTTATLAPTVLRNLSSTSGHISSSALPQTSAEYSPYHDIPAPIYGETRHTPQVSGSPFVMEEMTPEEAARLEEEERRIDAAIAEAERR